MLRVTEANKRPIAHRTHPLPREMGGEGYYPLSTIVSTVRAIVRVPPGFFFCSAEISHPLSGRFRLPSGLGASKAVVLPGEETFYGLSAFRPRAPQLVLYLNLSHGGFSTAVASFDFLFGVSCRNFFLVLLPPLPPGRW